MAVKKKTRLKSDTEGTYAATKKRLLVAQANKKDAAMAARGGSMPTPKAKLTSKMKEYSKYETKRGKKK